MLFVLSLRYTTETNLSCVAGVCMRKSRCYGAECVCVRVDAAIGPLLENIPVCLKYEIWSYKDLFYN